MRTPKNMQSNFLKLYYKNQKEDTKSNTFNKKKTFLEQKNRPRVSKEININETGFSKDIK